jgi:hypothetical protein
MCEDPSLWILYGVVENANGELIVGADVNLTEATHAYMEYNTVSFDKGRFEFEDIFKAQYILKIDAAGYQIYTKPVTVAGHTNTGTHTILEIPYKPTNVRATDNDTYATVTWGAPTVPPMTLKGYKVFRLLAGQEANPELWVTLTNIPIPDEMFYKDYTWATAGYGDYVWAVRTCYAGGVESEAAFSNSLFHNVEVKYTIQVSTEDGESPLGAVVDLTGDYTYSQLTPSTGTVTFAKVFCGDYTLDVTLDGYLPYTEDITIMGTGTTYVMLIKDIGIKEIEPGDYILYPVPAENKLYVERGTNELAYIEIYNPMGMFIHKYETTEALYEIDVAQLASGTYFIKVTEGNKIGVKGFVKK